MSDLFSKTLAPSSRRRVVTNAGTTPLNWWFRSTAKATNARSFFRVSWRPNITALFSVVVQAPDGETKRVRLSAAAYLGIVAATNFKQRTRKMIEYHYADLYEYAVAGTPNRLEYDLGFFVKNGDGAADFKPIAHLYKSQVFQLAAYLGVPEEIQRQPPTTDTYSLPQSQEEFYFMAPLETIDLCLYGKDHGISAADLAPATGLGERQVERMYRFITGKRNMARYLHSAALTVEPLSGA